MSTEKLERELARIERDRADLEQIREERRQARELLLSLLRAPWTRMSPWAISNVCAYLEHPSRIPEEPAPCPCGRFHDARPVELAEPE